MINFHVIMCARKFDQTEVKIVWVIAKAILYKCRSLVIGEREREREREKERESKRKGGSETWLSACLDCLCPVWRSKVCEA